MSEKRDKKPPSKALLYSEILNTSVADHVNELLQKKKKSFTHHVQRSSVLDRVSNFLQTIDKDSDDVKNIEEVEEGEPVIDMNLTLIARNESDSDTENEEDLVNDAEGKIIVYSTSESGQSRNKRLIDESVDISDDSDNELSEVKKYESVNNISSDFVSELPEIKKYKCEDICALYSDTDDELLESTDTDELLESTDTDELLESSDIDEQSESYNSGNEQSKNESKEVILGSQRRHHILPESNHEIPEESESNFKGKNHLEPSKSNFELLISDPSVPKIADHVNELLQKKKKSFAHHVQKSSVLDRVSNFLQTIDKDSDDVKNIEGVKEGEPVIDMNLSLIARNESDSDAENEDLVNDAEGKIIVYFNSESGQSRKKRLIDESVDISDDSDNELSEVEKYESVNNISSDFVSELPEIKKYKCEDICALYSATDDELLESSDTDELLESSDTDEQSESYDSGNEQSKNESKEVILGSQRRHHILPESNHEIPEESESNVKGKNHLEPSKSNFELLISDLSVPKCTYHIYKHDFGEKKRKLISVIDDDNENLSPKNQKRV